MWRHSSGWGQFSMSEGRRLTPVREEEYELIEQAVMETSRGRWFLAEYARRNRAADTRILLDAIKRLERIVSAQTVEFVPTLDSTNAVLKMRSLMQEAASDVAAILSQLDDEEDRLAARNDPLRAIDRVLKKQAHQLEEMVATLRAVHDEVALSCASGSARRNLADAVSRIAALARNHESVEQAVRRGIAFLGVLDQMLAKEQFTARRKGTPSHHEAATAAEMTDNARAVSSQAGADEAAEVTPAPSAEATQPAAATDLLPEGRIVIVKAPKDKPLALLPGFEDEAAHSDDVPQSA